MVAPRGPSLALAGIQCRHAEAIVANVLADVQHLVRTGEGSTALEIVKRDQAVAPLMAAHQLLCAAVAAIRALADQQPAPALSHQEQGEEACARG